MKPKTIIKTIFVILMWIIAIIINQVFAPVLTNEVALTQLNNTDASFIAYQSYQSLASMVVLLLVIGTILFYIRDIIKFIKKLLKK